MKYQIIGKNITVTEGISAAVTKKLARMERYFKDEDIDCRVVVSAHGETARIEITIFSTLPLRVEVEHKDLYAALDLAIDKLEGQMRKVKTRMDRSNGKISLGEAFFMDVEPEEEPDEKDVVVRAKSYYLTPMTIDEAITRMEALGHDFFVYLDKEDDLISVVYIRRDGGYGVIQAENQVK